VDGIMDVIDVEEEMTVDMVVTGEEIAVEIDLDQEAEAGIEEDAVPVTGV